MNTTDLHPYPDNPRVHGDGAGLHKSIMELGDLSGVVFNVRLQQLCGGHYRSKTIPPESIIESHPVDDPTGTVAEGTIILPTGQRLNYREVDWDEDRHKLACIEANNQKIQGEWDAGLLEPLLADLNVDLPEGDFEDFGLDELAGEFEFDFDAPDFDEEKDDELPPEPEHVVIKKGDLIELGRHRLLCGDSTDREQVEYLMGGEKAEILFTSPPYSDMREYNGGKDLSVNNLVQFIPTYGPYSDYQVVNLGIQRKGGEVVQYWDEYIQAGKDSGFKLLSWNIWDRGRGGSIGMVTADFPIEHEWIFVFGGSKVALNRTQVNQTGGQKSKNYVRNADGTKNKDGHHVRHELGKLGTIYRGKTDTNQGGDHPAVFPVELPEEYIQAMTQERDGVIDPFCGSGTTLIACEKTNRKCYGMELDEKYCQVITQRWCDYTQTGQIKINGQAVSWNEYSGV